MRAAKPRLAPIAVPTDCPHTDDDTHSPAPNQTCAPPSTTSSTACSTVSVTTHQLMAAATSLYSTRRDGIGNKRRSFITPTGVPQANLRRVSASLEDPSDPVVLGSRVGTMSQDRLPLSNSASVLSEPPNSNTSLRERPPSSSSPPSAFPFTDPPAAAQPSADATLPFSTSENIPSASSASSSAASVSCNATFGAHDTQSADLPACADPPHNTAVHSHVQQRRKSRRQSRRQSHHQARSSASVSVVKTGTGPRKQSAVTLRNARRSTVAAGTLDSGIGAAASMARFEASLPFVVPMTSPLVQLLMGGPAQGLGGKDLAVKCLSALHLTPIMLYFSPVPTLTDTDTTPPSLCARSRWLSSVWNWSLRSVVTSWRRGGLSSHFGSSVSSIVPLNPSMVAPTAVPAPARASGAVHRSSMVSIMSNLSTGHASDADTTGRTPASGIRSPAPATATASASPSASPSPSPSRPSHTPSEAATTMAVALEEAFALELSRRHRSILTRSLLVVIGAALIRIMYLTATDFHAQRAVACALCVVFCWVASIKDLSPVMTHVSMIAVVLSLFVGYGALRPSDSVLGPALALLLYQWITPARAFPVLAVSVGGLITFLFVIACAGVDDDRVSPALHATALLLFTTVTSATFHTLEATQRRHYQSEWVLAGQQCIVRHENVFFSDLLHSILPETVINQLYAKQFEIAQEFSAVSVMFIEICGLNSACQNQPVDLMISLLSTIYAKLDVLCDRHDVYKVETVGPVYMVVGGAPNEVPNHAGVLAQLALDIMDSFPDLRHQLSGLLGQKAHAVSIRVGINTGPIVAGVVGMTAPRYKLFGDTVNTASRMCTNSLDDRIQLSDTAYEELRACFKCVPRGKIQVKGKGLMATYFLEGHSHPHAYGKAGIGQRCVHARVKLIQQQAMGGKSPESRPALESLKGAEGDGAASGSAGGAKRRRRSSILGPMDIAGLVEDPNELLKELFEDHVERQVTRRKGMQTMLRGDGDGDGDDEDGTDTPARTLRRVHSSTQQTARNLLLSSRPGSADAMKRCASLGLPDEHHDTSPDIGSHVRPVTTSVGQSVDATSASVGAVTHTADKTDTTAQAQAQAQAPADRSAPPTASNNRGAATGNARRAPLSFLSMRLPPQLATIKRATSAANISKVEVAKDVVKEGIPSMTMNVVEPVTPDHPVAQRSLPSTPTPAPTNTATLTSPSPPEELEMAAQFTEVSRHQLRELVTHQPAQLDTSAMEVRRPSVVMTKRQSVNSQRSSTTSRRVPPRLSNTQVPAYVSLRDIAQRPLALSGPWFYTLFGGVLAWAYVLSDAASHAWMTAALFCQRGCRLETRVQPSWASSPKAQPPSKAYTRKRKPPPKKTHSHDTDGSESADSDTPMAKIRAAAQRRLSRRGSLIKTMNVMKVATLVLRAKPKSKLRRLSGPAVRLEGLYRSKNGVAMVRSARNLFLVYATAVFLSLVLCDVGSHSDSSPHRHSDHSTDLKWLTVLGVTAAVVLHVLARRGVGAGVLSQSVAIGAVCAISGVTMVHVLKEKGVGDMLSLLCIVAVLRMELLYLVMRGIVVLVLFSAVGYHALVIASSEAVASSRDPFAFSSFRVSAVLLGMAASTLAATTCLNEYYSRIFHYRDQLLQDQRSIVEAEKRRSQKLLCNILPVSIIDRLKAGNFVIADRFEEVTILFTDMVGFTKYSSRISARRLLAFLNAMFSRFDKLTEQTGCYKVEIIGDAYYVVSGCPTADPYHAQRIMELGLLMLAQLPAIRKAAGTKSIDIRMGVHTGAVVAGVVGITDPRYHLFGDTVEYAMGMEASGQQGQLHISDTTYQRVKHMYPCKKREVEVLKGQGRRTTYTVDPADVVDTSRPVVPVPGRPAAVTRDSSSRSLREAATDALVGLPSMEDDTGTGMQVREATQTFVRTVG